MLRNPADRRSIGLLAVILGLEIFAVAFFSHIPAEPLFGPGFLRSVGLEGDASDQQRLRGWLVRRLSRLLTAERSG